MKADVTNRPVVLLLVLLAGGFLANVVYCLLFCETDYEGSMAVFVHMLEAVVLLMLAIGMIWAFLRYSASGWWAVVTISFGICLFEIITVFVFEAGSWRYLYGFFVTIFFAGLFYSLADPRLLARLGVNAEPVSFLAKLCFSASVAFMVIYSAGSVAPAILLGTVSMLFLTRRAGSRRIEWAKRWVQRKGRG